MRTLLTPSFLHQEQPLLIEDLLEQEKQEQMKQQKASHQQQQEPLGPGELPLSDMDYEKIKADLLSVGNSSVGISPIPGMNEGRDC